MNGYQYVALRCVPRVDREEFVNVGVVLYCHADDFLGSARCVDEERLRALDPDVDLDAVAHALEAVEQVCRGEAHVDFGVGSRATAYGDREGRRRPEHQVRVPAGTAEHRRTARARCTAA